MSRNKEKRVKKGNANIFLAILRRSWMTHMVPPALHLEKKIKRKDIINIYRLEMMFLTRCTEASDASRISVLNGNRN